MFDRTFFKFALGFGAIIVFAIGTLYLAGYFDKQAQDVQTAAVK